MTRRVAYSPRARDQLTELLDYIGSAGSSVAAERFVSSVVAHCEGLARFPFRGVARDDLRPGLLVLGFRRRVTIAFAVQDTLVELLGIFYGGRDVETLLADVN